ncbi:uncharacterized protein LOC124812674 [Hydra vulgaris]|uniref:uncharacterized protein LOC124812674 n=1 Tax=Hydra vulgaris TaxID=6087 RepID=UPI001F5F28A4|nr:uncharacterized protein LOC124812674 [Hydra vulgaris]
MFATTTFRLVEKSFFLVWQWVQKCTLTENMKVRDGEGEFSEWLLKLGSGTINYITGENKSIVEKIFGDAQQDEYAKRVILTPTNVDSLSINEEVLERLLGEVKTYLSADQIETDDLNERSNFPVEFYSLTPSEILTGVSEGKRVFVPRIQLAPSDSNLPFVLKRRQFPVRLAYSMTIIKSQGQTFDRVGVYLKKTCFSHGQLHVACSRTRAFNSLFFKVDKHPIQGMVGGKCYTDNVIFSLESHLTKG